MVASLEGRGLFRWSINWVVDDVGVALAEPAGECVADPPWEGEAVPALEESLDFFEDLFESLVRESCSCYPCQSIPCFRVQTWRLWKQTQEAGRV